MTTNLASPPPSSSEMHSEQTPNQAKECILYACILEKGQTLVSEVKHRKYFKKYYADELQKIIKESVNFAKMGSVRILGYQREYYHAFLYKSNNFLYGCVSSKGYKIRVSDYFLSHISKLHKTAHLTTDPETLKNLLTKELTAANDPMNDPIAAGEKMVQQLITDAKRGMEASLARGESIDSLKDKTSAISNTVYVSNKKAKKLKWTAQKNLVIYYALTVFVLVLLLGTTATVAFVRFKMWKIFQGSSSAAAPAVKSSSSSSFASQILSDVERYPAVFEDDMLVEDGLDNVIGIDSETSLASGFNPHTITTDIISDGMPSDTTTEEVESASLYDSTFVDSHVLANH